jgi:hypothetical protein
MLASVICYRCDGPGPDAALRPVIPMLRGMRAKIATIEFGPQGG